MKHLFLLLCLLVAVCLMMPLRSLADTNYQDIVIQADREIYCSATANETRPFEPIHISPAAFAALEEEDLFSLLSKKGVETERIMNGLGQPKRYVFLDVPIAGIDHDVAALCYKNGASCMTIVFVGSQTEWTMLDVLWDIEQVELVQGVTNSWLKTKASAFMDSVELEALYNLSSRAYDVQYISRNSSFVDEYEVCQYAYSQIDESSQIMMVEPYEPEYRCYLYVVKNFNVLIEKEDSLIEKYSTADIDIYIYNYESQQFGYVQTNTYEELSGVTLRNLLWIRYLLPQMSIYHE